MKYKDYYKIIGLDRDASQEKIKRAYRKLARKYHPDVSKEKDAELKFKELGEAYEVLKDPKKRSAYDQLGSEWQAGHNSQQTSNKDAGFKFNEGYYRGSDLDESDFFETLFGQSRSHNARHQDYSKDIFRGEDHHAIVKIDIVDSYKGIIKHIDLITSDIDQNGEIVNKKSTLNVKIPKGVRQGQKIRLAGQGSKGIGNMPSGDLYLQIEFNSDPIYKVEGKDVFLKLPITPWEAALGAKVTVPTPDHKLELKIPPGSSGGQKLRLKKKGIPGESPGDLYVILVISVPPAKTKDEKDLYHKMEQTFNYHPRKNLGR